MPRLISEEFRRPGGKPPAAFLDTFPFANICSGSIATEMECPRYVRFPPNSDRRTNIAGCLKRANNGLVHPKIDHLNGMLGPMRSRALLSSGAHRVQELANLQLETIAVAR
jgi:hypothetical protein